MDSIFLFGTLCHAPLFEIVTGSHTIQTERVQLADHRVVRTNDESSPRLLDDPGAVAAGLLLREPTEEIVRRISYYEGGLGRSLQAVTVPTAVGSVPAQMYVPSAAALDPAESWSLEDWSSHLGPLNCMTAEEIMLDMDERSTVEVAQRLGPLKARAQARLNAGNSAPTTLRRMATEDDVRLRRRSLVHSRFFSVEEFDLAYAAFAGGFAPEVNRTAFVSADAVTVLPYDPVRDRVMLVEQFRAGPYARGDSQPWMLEAIAGRIDGGETPEQSAHREAMEEAGLKLRALHKVGEYYPTPGAKTEYLYGYVAIADLPDDASGHGGLEQEGEDIRSHVISFEQAMALVDTGEINVGPLILLLLHLARMRDDLRR